MSLHIAKNPALYEVAIGTPVLSLRPFQDGSFSFSGNSVIRRIWIDEVEFFDSMETLQRMKGSQILSSLAAQHLSLSELDLRKVGLHFDLQTEGARKPTEVTVTIQPPVFTDLAQKQYATIVEAYLKSQGVKLI